MTRFFNFKFDPATPASGPFDFTYKVFYGDTGYLINTGTNTNLSNVTLATLTSAGITGKVSGNSGDYLQSIIIKNKNTDCMNSNEYPIPFLVVKIDNSGGSLAQAPDGGHNYDFYVSGGVRIFSIAGWDGTPKIFIGLSGLEDSNYTTSPSIPDNAGIGGYFSSQYVNHTGNAAGYNFNKIYYVNSASPAQTGFAISMYSAILEGDYLNPTTNIPNYQISYLSTIVNSGGAGPYTGVNTAPAFSFN
jgi:hypothetical protein